MPATTNISLLGFFFAHLGNLWVLFCGFKKLVHHNGAKAAGKAKVLFRGQLLVAKKQQAMFSKCTAQFNQLGIGHRGQLQAANHCAAVFERGYLHVNL